MSAVDLRLGDCLEVMKTLPDGCVDLLLTDPVWPNAPAGMFPGVGDPEALLRDALGIVEAKRIVIVLRNDSDPRFLRAVPARWPFFKACWLPYVMPGYIGRKLGGDEIAYCFGEPTPSLPGRRVIPTRAPAVQPDGRAANGHPCSRAVRHFEWLVHWWSLPGETVLDPFMGSGTTGAACWKLGRNFIGIEIDPGYFEIAQKRIEEAQLQMRMEV